MVNFKFVMEYPVFSISAFYAILLQVEILHIPFRFNVVSASIKLSYDFMLIFIVGRIP